LQIVLGFEPELFSSLRDPFQIPSRRNEKLANVFVHALKIRSGWVGFLGELENLGFNI
jgi:hypothetical protein